MQIKPFQGSEKIHSSLFKESLSLCYCGVRANLNLLLDSNSVDHLFLTSAFTSKRDSFPSVDSSYSAAVQRGNFSEMGLRCAGKSDSQQTPEVQGHVDFSVQDTPEIGIVCIVPQIWVCLLQIRPIKTIGSVRRIFQV